MPAREEKDRSSQWLLQHHGAAALYLGGVRGVRSCKPLQAQLVHPKRSPDGLFEVHFEGRTDPDYFLVEAYTTVDRRAETDLLDDLVLVYQERRVLPEVLALVLKKPKRQRYRLPDSHTVQSRLGLARLVGGWRPVELWALQAEELLAANQVGLVPWVPLTRYDGPRTVLLQECRDRIDRQAPPEERANLLAVTQVMAELAYNDAALLAILGGTQVMRESPLIRELRMESEEKAARETRQEAILDVLAGRFGAIPGDLTRQIRSIRDMGQLRALTTRAAQCPDLESFRAQLFS